MTRKTTARGAVVAPQPEAAEAGWEVLRDGGNAFDAAVTVALVQCVVDPVNTSLGGSGCAVFFAASTGKAGSLSFMSRAGTRVRPDMWAARGETVDLGYTGACVPGNVRGLSTLLERYGTMPWARVLSPALELARGGFPAPRQMVREWHTAALGNSDPYMRLVTPGAQRAYLKARSPYSLGELFRQPDLAETLALLAAEGPDAFYQGDFAARVAEDSEANGGWLAYQDFAAYQARWEEPVTGAYRSLSYYGATPPASGAVVLHALRILSGYDLASLGHNSPVYLHLLAETFREVFAARQIYLGDGAPYAQFISEEAAARSRSRIRLDRVTPEPPVPSLPPDTGTTHLAAMDSAGNAVSLTHSIGNPFGSGVVPPGTGVLFNSHMDAFTAKPGGPNEIRPGKARRTAISSCLLLRDERPVLAVGASGYARIITATLQVILNAVDFQMTAMEAVAAPRLHWMDGRLGLERRLPEATAQALRAMGHRVDRSVHGLDPGFALCHLLQAGPVTAALTGACDPRAEGMALIV